MLQQQQQQQQYLSTRGTQSMHPKPSRDAPGYAHKRLGKCPDTSSFLKTRRVLNRRPSPPVKSPLQKRMQSHPESDELSQAKDQRPLRDILPWNLLRGEDELPTVITDDWLYDDHDNVGDRLSRFDKMKTLAPMVDECERVCKGTTALISLEDMRAKVDWMRSQTLKGSSDLRTQLLFLPNVLAQEGHPIEALLVYYLLENICSKDFQNVKAEKQLLTGLLLYLSRLDRFDTTLFVGMLAIIEDQSGSSADESVSSNSRERQESLSEEEDNSTTSPNSSSVLECDSCYDAKLTAASWKDDLLEPFSMRQDISEDVCKLQKKIRYSQRYQTDDFEYRHVILPKSFYENHVDEEFKGRLLREDEWRHIGICQSLGWRHYLIHQPEPHIFLFQRKLEPLPAASTSRSSQRKQQTRTKSKKPEPVKQATRRPKAGSKQTAARNTAKQPQVRPPPPKKRKEAPRNKENKSTKKVKTVSKQDQEKNQIPRRRSLRLQAREF